jgi:hypothetical protein
LIKITISFGDSTTPSAALGKKTPKEREFVIPLLWRGRGGLFVFIRAFVAKNRQLPNEAGLN